MDALRELWFESLRPLPPQTVSEWADSHRVLSSRGASEPGPYRTERTPYLREIMDALSPQHPAQRVVFMKSAQIGATEAGNNWIGYMIHHAPGPMLAVQPTVELARRFSQQRVSSLIEDSPALRELVSPARSRDSGNTILSKEFPGGILVLTGANSAVGLRSMPARYLFLDEIDAYPPSADDEGDPVSLAEARTRTFSSRRKIFMTSTPTVRDVSRIEREFAVSDQRRFFVPCPHCGRPQHLIFERLRWQKGQPETAAYVCEGCEQPIAEHYKTQMFATGEWRATAEAADPRTVGFHLSGLYSPVGWLSWEQIARDWEACQSSIEAKRSFINTVLGETWIELGDAPETIAVLARRSSYVSGTIPPGVLFLTAGADVQKDRVEVSVWGWGKENEAWLIEHRVIPGGPSSEACWSALDDFVEETWPLESGGGLGLKRLAIDSGYDASAVYRWTRRGFCKTVAVKGVHGYDRSVPVAGPTLIDSVESGRRIKRGGRLYTVSTAVFKTDLYRRLRADPGHENAAMRVHMPADLEEEVAQQLVAEHLVSTRSRQGFVRMEWHKIKGRNEALDCWCYASAARWLLGSERWSQKRWSAMEREIELLADCSDDAIIPSVVVAAKSKQVRSSYIDRDAW